jgi:hypothetical protein
VVAFYRVTRTELGDEYGVAGVLTAALVGVA